MAAKKSRKKFLIIGSAAVLAIGGAGLYAGALTVNNNGNIGAGSTSVSAACDTTVVATAGTAAWNPSANKYQYSSVAVSDIDAVTCAGQDITVTVAGPSGSVLSSGTLTDIDAATETVTLGSPVDASLAVGDANYQVLIQS